MYTHTYTIDSNCVTTCMCGVVGLHGITPSDIVLAFYYVWNVHCLKGLLQLNNNSQLYSKLDVYMFKPISLH